MDDNADPSDGLMNMLKKIYSEGDDEMKRTINKVWTESQEKRLRGEETMDFWTALSDPHKIQVKDGVNITQIWKCDEVNNWNQIPLKSLTSVHPL